MSTKLRIEFSVREPNTERFVTFADDVSIASIRDWFIRTSIGVEQLFNCPATPRGIWFKAITRPSTINKIMAIKLVRELTGHGLKEAKDAVDESIAHPGRPFLVCNDGRDAPAVVERFQRERIDVEDGLVGDCTPGSIPSYRSERT